MNYGKFYKSYDYPGISISTKGYVYDNIKAQIIEPYFKNRLAYIHINNDDLKLVYLMRDFFIGHIDCSIEFKDRDWRNCAISNLFMTFELPLILVDTMNFYIGRELFSRIPEYDNYFISRKGVVFGRFYSKFIIRSFNYAGYPTVAIIDNDGIRSPKKVHRLVYKTYIGSFDPSMTIDHVNGNRQNPDYDNLEQITQLENNRRAREIGNAFGRWDIPTIMAICDGISHNIPSREIAASLGLYSQKEFRDLTMLIHNIRKGAMYVDISQNYDLTHYKSAINKRHRKLSISDVDKIREMLASGNMLTTIADKFSCTPSTISKVRDGKTWAYDDLSVKGSTTIESIST